MWGLGEDGGSQPTNGKSPNLGVTETQVTCETASKFCHLSELFCLQKRMLKQTLRGLDEIIDYSGQSALWETIDIIGDSAQSSLCWALHLQGKQDGDIAPKSYPHPPRRDRVAGA